MLCRNCGRQLDEGENFCPACGTVNATETPSDTTVQFDLNAVDTANERMKEEMAGQAFKWGLMSLIFSGTACLSLLGFIFSFIAKSKALAYRQTYGMLEGKAKVGRILGKIGFGLGLGLTIYMSFFVFVFLLGFITGLTDPGMM
jgi:RNA polymerase subunit RPABC4/transcription elongation factor Spt4